MHYQIVATLGPASDQPRLWQELLNSGCTTFRINTSHVSLSELSAWLDRLSGFFKRQGLSVPLILDLQGSKWRLGHFAPFHLESGSVVELVHAEKSDQPRVLPVPHADFFYAAANYDSDILVNDAKSRISMEEVTADWIRGRVVQGGEISGRKGIALPGCAHRQESLSVRDETIVRQTRGREGVGYAISFVKDGSEMAGYRAWLGANLFLVGKLERKTAVLDADAVAQSADQLWLCRGDLGQEAGLTEMARLTAEFGSQQRRLPAPTLLAGQVLEHLTKHPQPTRSEVCHLHDSLQQGYSGVVLSDETAIGQYPVESCRMAALFRDVEIKP